MKKNGLKEDILKLRSEGKTYNEIIKLLNCSKGVISYYCKEYSLMKVEVDNDEVKRFFKKVKNANETIKKFKITKKKLTNIVGSTRKMNCEVCGKEMDASIFSPKVFCSGSCKKEYRISYMKNNKYFYESVKNWRNDKKERAVRYKGGKCSICGYSKCASALEFHHIDPLTKDFSISKNINHHFDRIKEELDKCILVCSNCHREIHEKINVQVAER